MSELINPVAFEKMIRATLEEELNQAAEPLIEKMMEDYEKVVRKRIGVFVVGVLSEYEVRSDGRRMHISVGREIKS